MSTFKRRHMVGKFVYVYLCCLIFAAALPLAPAEQLTQKDLENIFGSGSFAAEGVDDVATAAAERETRGILAASDQLQKRSEQISPLWLQGSQLGSSSFSFNPQRQSNLQAAAQKVGVNPQLTNFIMQKQQSGMIGPQGSLAQAGRMNSGIVGRGGGNRRRFNLQNKLVDADGMHAGDDALGFDETSITGSSGSSSSYSQCGIIRPKITSYVANGVVTDPHEQPWYAQLTIGGLHRNDSSTFCGGTLISRHHIITAAHCYDEISASKRAKSTLITMKGILIDDDKYFRQGGAGGMSQSGRKSKSRKVPLQFRATHVYLHQHYVPAMSEMEARLLNKLPGPKHDLAIIEFEFEDSEITELLIPVCLPGEGAPVKPGMKCKVMGHGFMNADDEDKFVMPSELQSADVVISSNQACRDEVDSVSIKSKISADTICIRGPMHPCVGDSGGPLVCADSSSDMYKSMMRSRRRASANSNDVDVEDMADDGGVEYDDDDEHHLNLDEHEYDDDDENGGGSGGGEEEDITLMSYRTKRHFLVGVTSFAVSTDQHDRCGQFRSAVFGKISNYIPWIKSITGLQ